MSFLTNSPLHFVILLSSLSKFATVCRLVVVLDTAIRATTMKTSAVTSNYQRMKV